MDIDGNEFISYIKECGAEIKELQDKISKLEEEKLQLTEEIGDLKVKLENRDTQIENISQLSNKWYWEYDNLKGLYNDILARQETLAGVLGVVLPKLKDEIDEDFEEGLFSDLKDILKVRRW